MEPSVQARPESSPVPRGTWNHSEPPDPSEIPELRAQLERLKEREAQMMALIGCKNPEKLVHDLRNVLNELQLLRMVSEIDKG